MLQPLAGAQQSRPRQAPRGILATLALAFKKTGLHRLLLEATGLLTTLALAPKEIGVHRLLLQATGVLATNLLGTQASVIPTSPSTQTVILAPPVALVQVVMMVVASKLVSSQLSPTCTDDALVVATLAILLATAPSLGSRLETALIAVKLGETCFLHTSTER